MNQHPTLHVVANGEITADEAKLLAAYRATADFTKPDMLVAANAIARVSPRQRPVLTMVPTSQPWGAL